MTDNIKFYIDLVLSFLPFVLFAFFNNLVNTKKNKRYRQYIMPVVALVYSIVLFAFLNRISQFFLNIFLKIASLFELIRLTVVSDFIIRINTPTIICFMSFAVLYLK